MNLFTLFIEYSSGGHYCGVYLSLDVVVGVIKGMMADEKIVEKELPSLEAIKDGLLRVDEFGHKFTNGAWINIQEVVAGLVVDIVRQIQGTLPKKVTVNGIKCLMFDGRDDGRKEIMRKTYPVLRYMYDMRHGDNWNKPSAIENRSVVNYYATILSTRKFKLNKEGYADIKSFKVEVV